MTQVPKGIPGFSPKAALQVTPVSIGVTVLIEAERQVTDCILGKKTRAKKTFPKIDRDKETMMRPKRKRQRPCRSGKPKIEYVDDPPKEIGTFTYRRQSKLWSKAAKKAGDQIIRSKTEKVAEKAGFEINSEGERIYSELSRPETVKEWAGFLLNVVGGAADQGECFYRVYYVRRRRKCTCPDGSRCRGTTKR